MVVEVKNELGDIKTVRNVLVSNSFVKLLLIIPRLSGVNSVVMIKFGVVVTVANSDVLDTPVLGDVMIEVVED